ncbi:hypothetical protein IE077_003888, partial [Cardiosporidium cionae]
MFRMVSAAVVDFINKSIGDFVEGFDQSQIDFSSLLSGTISLKHVQLKQTLIDSMNLPLHLVSSYIGQFYIHFPLHSFFRGKIKLHIKDCVVLVSTKPFHEWKSDKFKEFYLQNKRKGLDNGEFLTRLVASEGGLMWQMLLTLFNNLYVEIENFHFRIEDYCSRRQHNFAMGASLRYLVVSGEAVPHFYTPEGRYFDETSGSSVRLRDNTIFKVLLLQGFGFYVDTLSNESSPEFTEIKEAFANRMPRHPFPSFAELPGRVPSQPSKIYRNRNQCNAQLYQQCISKCSPAQKSAVPPVAETTEDLDLNLKSLYSSPLSYMANQIGGKVAEMSKKHTASDDKAAASTPNSHSKSYFDYSTWFLSSFTDEKGATASLTNDSSYHNKANSYPHRDSDTSPQISHPILSPWESWIPHLSLNMAVTLSKSLNESSPLSPPHTQGRQYQTTVDVGAKLSSYDEEVSFCSSEDGSSSHFSLSQDERPDLSLPLLPLDILGSSSSEGSPFPSPIGAEYSSMDGFNSSKFFRNAEIHRGEIYFDALSNDDVNEIVDVNSVGAEMMEMSGRTAEAAGNSFVEMPNTEKECFVSPILRMNDDASPLLSSSLEGMNGFMEFHQSRAPLQTPEGGREAPLPASSFDHAHPTPISHHKNSESRYISEQ